MLTEVRSHCKRRGCEFYGDPNQEGYCSRCYFGQREAGTWVHQTRQYPPSVPIQSMRQPRPHTSYGPVPSVPKPRAYTPPGPLQSFGRRDRDRDLRLQVAEERRTHSDPLSSSIEDVYPNTDPLERIECGARRVSKQCLTPSCKNLGNAKCHGYCNACFSTSRIRHY
jgi:hypothetical protein